MNNYFKNQIIDSNYTVLTMGTFDGVHLGHQKLLKVMSEKAKENNGLAVVITYYHHPLETVKKKTYPYLITEKDRKERLLKKYGADQVVYLEFNNEMAEMKAGDFLEKIIVGELKAQEIVVGYDTHFGKNREGNYNFLKLNEKKYSFKTDVVDPVSIDGKTISSSEIRAFIRKGDLQRVRSYTGRDYCLIGNVISGEQIGRKIGFPTINVSPSDSHKLLPATGVYFGQVQIGEIRQFCICNVGFSPTVKHLYKREVEAFLIDFKGNLYGDEVEITLFERLRGEKKFSGLQELTEAIKKDEQTARELIKKVNAIH